MTAILREASRAIVMRRFQAAERLKISFKAAGEPVTAADEEAEAWLRTQLEQLLPGSCAIGEEACGRDPDLLNALSLPGYVWLIDPIDGTRNYAAGVGPFAIMVALLKGGETVASWILDPRTDTMVVAGRGSGTWINGVRIRAAQFTPPVGDLVGIISNAFVPEEAASTVDRLRRAVRQTNPTARCAGHEYPLVAQGTQHFALYWRTLPWDHAAGALMLEEAGGKLCHLDGCPYSPTAPRSGLLLAHNPAISAELLELIGSASSRHERD